MTRRALVLRVSRDELRLVAERGAVVAAAPWRSVGDLAEAVARLAAELPRRPRRIAVVLERPVVQLRTIPDLPPVKPRALAALVANQAGRFFRKNGKPLVTDATWSSEDGRPVAKAAAVEEPVVDAIVTGARAAGVEIVAIGAGDVSLPLSLLPIGERATRQRQRRRQVRRLALAAASVWAAAALLFVGRLAIERRRVAAELDAMAAPLRAVLDARRQTREVEEGLLVVGDADRARGRALGVLAGLAEALPDSAVITSLTWGADGQAIVTGAARRAGDVLAALERARALPNPRFEGPIVREAIAGREWERFTIVGGREAGSGRREPW